MAKEAKFTVFLFRRSEIMHLGLRAESITLVKVIRMTINLCWSNILVRIIAIDARSRRHNITSTLRKPWYLDLLLLWSQLLLFHHTVCFSLPRLLLVMRISNNY